MLQRVAGRRRVRRPARGAVLIPDRCGPARHRGAQAGVRSGRSGAGSFRVLVDHASGHSWSYPTPPPRPGSVRFLGGIGRGRLAVPERAESGFPHVAEEAPGGAGAGCGAQAAGAGCKHGVRGAELWAPEGPGRLARRNAPRLLCGRGADSSFRGAAPEPGELNDTDM